MTSRRMGERVLVLGAGFGGLALTTILSEALGRAAEVILIDRGDAFVFGYSKLDVMFGLAEPGAIRLPYQEFVKPGVRLLRETITAIDPNARRVTTDAGVHEADHLAIALGADYDFAATPGLSEGGSEFYSMAGARAGSAAPADRARARSHGPRDVGERVRTPPPVRWPPAGTMRMNEGPRSVTPSPSRAASRPASECRRVQPSIAPFPRVGRRSGGRAAAPTRGGC